MDFRGVGDRQNAVILAGKNAQKNTAAKEQGNRLAHPQS
jgi:hypothetical protein